MWVRGSFRHLLDGVSRSFGAQRHDVLGEDIRMLNLDVIGIASGCREVVEIEADND